MEQFKVKIGLINIIIGYAKKIKIIIPVYCSIILISSFFYIFIAKITITNVVYSISSSMILSLITGSSLRYLGYKLIDVIIDKHLTSIINILLISFCYGIANISILVIIDFLSSFKTLILQVLPIMIDITFISFVYKYIKKDNSNNKIKDITFYIKFGLFYFFARIISMMIISLLLSSVLPIEERVKYFPTIGNIIKLIFLPILFHYFACIEDKESSNNCFERTLPLS